MPMPLALIDSRRVKPVARATRCCAASVCRPPPRSHDNIRSDGRMSCPLLTLAGALAHHHGGREDRFGLSLRLVPWRGLQISVLMQMIGADELMRTTSGPGSAQSLSVNDLLSSADLLAISKPGDHCRSEVQDRGLALSCLNVAERENCSAGWLCSLYEAEPRASGNGRPGFDLLSIDLKRELQFARI